VTPVDPKPLDQVETLDLLREYDLRLRERDCLGVRTRIAELEAEIEHRARRVSA
jgi:hypothetical protein